jgi:hypothetical protein
VVGTGGSDGSPCGGCRALKLKDLMVPSKPQHPLHCGPAYHNVLNKVLSSEQRKEKQKVQQEVWPQLDAGQEGEGQARQLNVMIKVLSGAKQCSSSKASSKRPHEDCFGCRSLEREPHGAQEIICLANRGEQS